MKTLQPYPLAEVLKKIPLIYLATPYSKYPPGIELAFKDASKLAAELLRAGLNIFCPIAHTHPIATYGNIDPLDHEIWIPFDKSIMSKSDALLVSKMDTWEISYGITKEIEYFRAVDKPVFLIDPYTMEVERDPYGLRRKKRNAHLHRSPGLLPSGVARNSQGV